MTGVQTCALLISDLAAWVLRNKPEWTPAKIQDAMQNGPDNQQVNLDQPIPVLILYSSAVVEPDGEVRFFSDIYGYDKSLEKVLANGPPYPNAPAPAASGDAY